MSVPIIQIEKLGKRYRIAHQAERHRYVALRDVLADTTRSVARRLWSLVATSRGNASTRTEEDFWALRNVSFDVQEGEVLGIIGRNGAGKSTLLKILSRITEPTEGRVRVRGRVASLLEVGTGFHPELTGRENIFLNGAILGMTRAEIRRKFDEIVAFAEVDKFLDTPVKRYSSGMYVRLAFAVAAHLEPEILLVDEVLAVGDAQFQKKCLGKMGAVARGGRTVLFVSHNMVAVRSLCGRAVLLANGEMEKVGPVGQLVAAYVDRGGARLADRIWTHPHSAPGNDLVTIRRIRVGPAGSSAMGVIGMETPVLLELEYERLQADKEVHFTFHLINQDEVIVLTSTPGPCPTVAGTFKSRCTIPGNLLNSGGYRLKLLIVEDGSRVTWSDESLASFSVADLRERNGAWLGREPSAVQPILPWHTETVVPEPAVQAGK